MSKILVYGHGVNDVNYAIRPRVDGKQVRCPFYATWSGMLMRAYSPGLHAQRPTYAEVTVCEEWLYFSKFKKWMEAQPWEGRHLDKDIVRPGNTEYSPDTCRFVTPYTNSLLSDSVPGRGAHPRGVTKRDGRYIATCSDHGRNRHLGRYATANEAYQAYATFKISLILRAADTQSDAAVAKGLRAHADLLAPNVLAA
jgi:hypothetical protein